jgi:hypothetical protein
MPVARISIRTVLAAVLPSTSVVLSALLAKKVAEENRKNISN